MAASPETTGGTSPEVAILIGVLTELGVLPDGNDDRTDEVLAAILAVGGVLNNQIEDIYQSIKTTIDQQSLSLDETETVIERIVGSLILNQDTRISQTVWDAANAITAWHESRGTATGNDIEEAKDTIVSDITNVLLAVLQNRGDLAKHVTNENSRVIRQLTNDNAQLRSILDDRIGQSNNILTDILGAVTRPVEQTIENIIQIPGDILDGVLREVRGIIGDQERDLRGAIGEVTRGILGPIQSVGREISLAIPDTQDELTHIGLGFDRLNETVEQYTGEWGDTSKAAKDIWREMYEELNRKVGEDVDRREVEAQPGIESENVRDYIRDSQCFRDYLISGNLGVAGTALETLVSTFTRLFTGRLGVFLNIRQNIYARELRKCLADSPMTIEDIRNAYRQYHLTNREATGKLREHGLSDDDIAVMLESIRAYSSPFEYLHWWHRGLMDEDRLDRTLLQMGYSDSDKDDMKRASYFIPPPQDLIVMAVREVFSPEQRAANRQDENFPPEFARFAGMQGVSEEWARNYWAAHWTLPSPQQGFEMFQRDVITREQLDALLVALDIMPAWRDRLTAIAYRPIGRIDIRRIHALGQISDEELVDRYRFAGYSPQDAQSMADFTIAYNAEPDQEATNEAAGATRASIIGFYKDGILDRQMAYDGLIGIGVGTAAAEAFLDQADIDLDYAENAQNVQLVIAAFRAQRRNYEQSRNILVALNLPAKILARAIFQLDLIRERQTKNPTKADLVKFQKAGFITDQEYKDRLVLLGYSGADAELYRRLLVEQPEQESGGPTIEIVNQPQFVPEGSFEVAPGSPLYGTN